MWLYFIFKALHLIGAVAWFAGLFYLVRMFVYHTEAYDKAEPEGAILRQQFQLMESRVYKIICNPAMMITVTFGIAMLVNHPAYLKSPWIHVKLTLVILLLGYHLYCKKIMKQLEKGRTSFSSFQFRLFNELPTLFLVAIVFLAVFKDNLNLITLFGGIFLFGLILFAVAKAYKARSGR
jgi:protoporphyrinogen IX oxidase